MLCLHFAWYKGATTLSITTLRIMTFGITIIYDCIMALSIKTFSIMTVLLYWVSFMVSVIYGECHLCWEWFMLSVAISPLCGVSFMLSVVMLSVVAPIQVYVSFLNDKFLSKTFTSEKLKNPWQIFYSCISIIVCRKNVLLLNKLMSCYNSVII